MKNIYYIHEFYRKKDGDYMIVAKENNNPRSAFKMEAKKLVTTRKDLLHDFNVDDITNIIGLASTEQPPIITVNENRQFKYFPILAMLYGCCLIASNIASEKLIIFFGTTLTGGTIPYTITYVIGDIIAEVYGFKRIRILIWGSIICNLVVVLFIQIALYSTPSPLYHYQTEYSLILGAAPRIIISSMISYFISEFLNSYAISKLKISYSGTKLWLRIIIASLIGMTVDNFLFLSLAYYHVMPLSEMIGFSSRSYIISLVAEWSCIPLIKIITDKLKKYENSDVYDINTNFNPFSIFDVDYKEKNTA